MPTNTTNLNLVKPLGNEVFRIKNINDNMDAIDTAVGNLSKLPTIDKTSLVDAMKEVDAKVESQKNDIKSLNKIKKNITITTTGWTLDNTLNLYKYKILDVDITADTVVDINIRLADLEKASDFKSANESGAGYVEIYSESIPTSAIVCDLKVQRQVV
ncbi:MAG: hypothetical protein RR782_02720 [Clostridium sp.]